MNDVDDNNEKIDLKTDVENCFNEIYKHNEGISKERYLSLYHKTFNFCFFKKQSFLYKVTPTMKLYKLINNLLEDYVILLFSEMSDLNGEELLKRYLELWNNFHFKSEVYNGICSYLNRHCGEKNHRLGNGGIYHVYQLAMIKWRDNLFSEFTNKLSKEVLNLIERERNGEVIDTRLVNNMLNYFLHLGCDEDNLCTTDAELNFYKTSFEPDFLKDSERFYNRKCSEFLSNNISFVEYIKKVENILHEEENRVQHYLLPCVKEPLMKVCKKTFIENNMDFFSLELINLMKREEWDCLKRMYRLLSILESGLNEISKMFENYVKTEGLDAISKSASAMAKDPKLFINRILEIRKKYYLIFNDYVMFCIAIDEACKAFINNNAITIQEKNSNKSAELLAKHCDLLLRNTKFGKEEDIEKASDEFIIVFGYIENKDAFENYYGKRLAKRLVNQLSVDDGAESLMIRKLKEVCGIDYTSRLQRMFQDITVSKDLNERFKQHSKTLDNPLNLYFSIKVLTSGFWPFKTKFTFSLPLELENSVQKFTNFYVSQHSGKQLQWLHSYSSGEIYTNCFKNQYTFKLSTFQMAVLLQFNKSLSWTIQELHDATQIKMECLIQIIKPFLKGNLLETENCKKLSPSSVLKLSMDYNNKKLKMNFNLPLKLDEKEEHKLTERDILEGRKLIIQATIVRIMKMRKTLQHQELVIEVINQLGSKFNPTISIIKKCIDILLEKEYLERKNGEKETYNYLA